jgi:death on curing protein
MIKFLPLDIVLAFHEDQIKEYGGKTGIRDINLLKSALAQPEASFGGEYVHSDIFEMAAAYGFHICKNHPFFDGNKRTAFLAMYTFLHVNGWELIADKKLTYAVVMDLAAGKLSKEELTDFLRNNSKKRD